MKLLKRLSRGTKDAFWEVVHDCLVELAGVPLAEARELCIDRRAAVEFVPKHLRSDIYYHRQPIEVASALAASHLACAGGQPLNVADQSVAPRYQAILSRHGLG